MKNYEIIVVGGGHAGAEAAWAAARMGCATALVTMSIEATGRMSCNPAVGGLGKGQIVREIDALGGMMGLAIDEGGIQYRILNRSKGPAVQAPRAQADRKLYAAAVQRLLRDTPGLDLVEGIGEELLVGESDEVVGHDGDRHRKLKVKGIRLQDGRELSGEAVILTAGTFLSGLMHCGEEKTVGGRIHEPSADKLSENLRKIGLQLGRLKTGTPARVVRDSVKLEQLDAQDGERPIVPFSYMTDSIERRQIQCWITYTNERTHEIIKANLDRAPMYSGQIKSRGPRYCPSIEDKVVRFADKNAHQIFLEPEGYDASWLYCNGIPTSLPRDVQEDLVHSIAGMEKAEIAQYGYAIEYDWIPTDQIRATCETKAVKGLFLAGQVNGTSGYEEAGGQGLMAAINAVQGLRGEEQVVLGRDEAYIGVMLDDIVTRPPDEPYRMFTSRAEYRLHLRSDNADMRLTPLGRRIGLVDDQRWQRFVQKRAAIEKLKQLLQENRLEGKPLSEWMRRPDVNLRQFAECCETLKLSDFSASAIEAVEIQAKYAGYLEREERLIKRYKQMEARGIPESFDYHAIQSLRREAQEKFARMRPRSLGQAARISGISPADIATLSIYLGQGYESGTASSTE